MKRILFLLIFYPFFVNAQSFEVGLNDGNVFDITGSIKLFHHVKIGLGYEYAKGTNIDILSSLSTVTTTIGIPYWYAEYYQRKRKHEFYFGFDFGRVYLKNELSNSNNSNNSDGNALGVHAGYSIKLYHKWFFNGQIGYKIFHTKASDNSFSEDGAILPVSLGIHYLFRP